MNMKKLFLLNLPYLLFVYPFDKLAQAFRLAPGADLSGKLLSIGDGFTAALSSPWLSFHPTDLLIGIAGAVILRMAVYLKGKNAKKYRHGIEYGSARWGTAADIAPYMDKDFFQNIPMTQTERITMASRPKQPKYARNKNILVIGGSGSGKTRFFCKPSLLQAHSSYPYSDPVALVCNDEGKLIGLDLNRGLRDENGEIYDIVAGTFLVVGLGEEDFASLSPELIQKYTEQFKTPEQFMQINGNIVVLPVPAAKQDLAYLPDRFETGERVQTPRGSFQVTAMSREQMEAAGYGVHHISDDGKYLIMGNGTRAFAVAAEQPEKDNPLRTAEMTLEDDYGMIDGVINNGRRGEELEKAQEYAERTTTEKPSIRERLEDAKRECAEHKPPEGKKPGRDVPEHDCL